MEKVETAIAALKPRQRLYVWAYLLDSIWLLVLVGNAVLKQVLNLNDSWFDLATFFDWVLWYSAPVFLLGAVFVLRFALGRQLRGLITASYWMKVLAYLPAVVGLVFIAVYTGFEGSIGAGISYDFMVLFQPFDGDFHSILVGTGFFVATAGLAVETFALKGARAESSTRKDFED